MTVLLQTDPGGLTVEAIRERHAHSVECPECDANADVRVLLDLVDAVEDFTEQVTEMAETVGERASEILEKGKDMAYGAKKGLLKAIADGEARLEKERSRLSKMIG